MPRNEEIAQEVRAYFEGLDVGPFALYEMIAFHIGRELPEVAESIAATAYFAHTADGFVEEATTNTDLFLYVFEKVCFSPMRPGVFSPAEYEQWVDSMERAATFLKSYADQVRDVIYVGIEATPDDSSTQ